MTTAALAPCPFCGGEATVQPWVGQQAGEKIAKIRCTRCSAQSAPYADESYAAAAWNRRAPNDQTEALAQWMLARGIATGHGDTVADLLRQLALEWDARAPALRWRREPPTEPGWWWLWWLDGTTPHIAHYGAMDCRAFDAQGCNPNVRWAGPIPPPEEGAK